MDPQVPITRAIQRDERRLNAGGLCRGPAEGEGPPPARTLVFVDESGFYLLPGVVKT